ncbi:hypothetical protein H0H93_004487 [Arthromyces matolae]|nr:hypothetical protein H0H93_004487 [Arthromyces matolae]
MSYAHYTPPAGTHPPTSTTYPYGAYHPAAYQQTPGAYPYAPSYQTGVTSYGWPYPYPWPHPVQQTHTPTPVVPQASTSAVAVPATTPHVAQTPIKSTMSFTPYTPSYMRESVAAAASGGATGRGSRKQSYRGLFTKELKNIMYGFGDDRNPANDTVNVMEEILVEYIMDVCTSAGGSSRKARLSIDDLRRALSRPADSKKLARMEELLFMQEDIKRARAQFQDDTNTAEF